MPLATTSSTAVHKQISDPASTLHETVEDLQLFMSNIQNEYFQGNASDEYLKARIRRKTGLFHLLIDTFHYIKHCTYPSVRF